jgi:hypothetical protein
MQEARDDPETCERIGAEFRRFLEHLDTQEDERVKETIEPTLICKCCISFTHLSQPTFGTESAYKQHWYVSQCRFNLIMPTSTNSANYHTPYCQLELQMLTGDPNDFRCPSGDFEYVFRRDSTIAAFANGV